VTQIEVDARGLRCPLPVIRLAAAARDAPAGALITVLATDPAARHDVPAWCRMRDHELREMTEVPETTGGSGGSDVSDGSGMTEVSDPTGTEVARGDQPAYLRFVVVVRRHPSKAAGAGSSSARSSRAM
jgi:TusA-related sulfurtransferase